MCFEVPVGNGTTGTTTKEIEYKIVVVIIVKPGDIVQLQWSIIGMEGPRVNQVGRFTCSDAGRHCVIQ